MNRRGFALPLAVVVMVALSLVAVSALQVATADFQANRSMRLAARALFAAEAGAAQTMARWGSGPYATLAPGDSSATGWTRLPDGAMYRSTVLRVDDGTPPQPIFRIRTEGRPSRTSAARRQIFFMVQATSGAACCEATVTLRGRIRLRAPNAKGGKDGEAPLPQIDGRDHVPVAWAGYCPTPSSGVPGIILDDEDNLELQNGAYAAGTPPLTEDPGLTRSLADLIGGVPYAELADRADIRFTRNSTRLRDDIGPSARSGVCYTDDDQNWGAPTQPGTPCWDYLPVIHAAGNLQIAAEGEGQGILLVDGDLTISDEFHFYGIVVVKGTLVLRSGAAITGALFVVNDESGNARSEIRDESFVRFSACATARVSGEAGGGASPLPGRYWFEIP